MDILFQALQIGYLKIRNRFMRSATAERLSDDQTGEPLERLSKMYDSLSKGGIGIIVTGHAFVMAEGKAHSEMSGIYDDALIPIWRKTISPAQQHGAKVVMQINHKGVKFSSQAKRDAKSPFANLFDIEKLTQMSAQEIQTIIEAFGHAARRAKLAGLDGVQIHAAHGFLISQFLSPETNHRLDRYGGNEENRFHILHEVISECRSQVGKDYPLWIKLGIAGGLNIEEGARIAKRCVDAGIDCIEISFSVTFPKEFEKEPEPTFQKMAKAVREQVGPDFPLALSYGFKNLSVMKSLVQSGLIDLVSMSRPFIREPDLINKFEQGKSDCATCIRCNRCWPEKPGDGISCKINLELK